MKMYTSKYLEWYLDDHATYRDPCSPHSRGHDKLHDISPNEQS